ncbi:Metal transporter Nramp3 [Camellia lanceoleosa]|uniref:Metal transporter Nramp3 n=1 Tax=Camellia lanceoleosa TaxID=1840588 RepID=A0ACC0GDM2_9ERIC|nr:Metal transporter Nramp3 [Camellia lanceoleosa]
MEKQGVYGPKPRFLVGKISDMASLVSKSTSKCMDSINHDIVGRLLLHFLIWSKQYGQGDIQAGAIAGYSLLWLLLWATAMGLLVQLLAARLGLATGKHLAELCREEYPKWARWLLWVMVEVALIGADIQQVIGSAIAIKILSNGVVPLWGGVVISACDCFIFLFLENYGVRKLEAVFAVLIATMALSFAWMFGETEPNGVELLLGLLIPKLSSKTIQQAVGVVGCIIMPHNIFLHSALVQSREIDRRKTGRVKEALNYYSIESTVALTISFTINLFVTAVFAKAFYGTDIANSIGLVNAGQYLQEKYGGGILPILYIWGIGLLAAGQSSTLTDTYAGQFIMGGFLNLRLKKWLRALITRSCAIIPIMIVALAFDTSEDSLDVLNEWLNVLQSVQIPFALIPLLCLVSKEEVMDIFKIGLVLKMVSWLVAALVIVINGYLLLEFFYSEVNGWLLSSVVSAFTAAHLAFIIYLTGRSITFSN